jgi:hypothetical protein
MASARTWTEYCWFEQAFGHSHENGVFFGGLLVENCLAC